jgi:hypothetical protein
MQQVAAQSADRNYPLLSPTHVHHEKMCSLDFSSADFPFRRREESFTFAVWMLTRKDIRESFPGENKRKLWKFDKL